MKRLKIKKIIPIIVISLMLFSVLAFAETIFTACIVGQSNGGTMSCPYTTQMTMPISLNDGCGTATANPNVYVGNSTGSSAGTAWVSPGTGSGSDSSGLVAFGNAINNATGWVVHMINLSFGGSSIFEADGSTIAGWWWNTNNTPSTDAQTGNVGFFLCC
jgi:hypothetical protein